MKAVLETWRPIRDYEGLYDVSDLGSVRSHYGKKVKYLKCHKAKNGYCYLNLYKNNKKKTCKVHRLVYEAFNCPIPDGMQIDHIDGDKTNNTIANLRAVSPKVNTNNPVTRVRHLEAIKKRTLSEEWRQNNREAKRRLAKDPKWRQKNRDANRRLAKDPQWLQKNRDANRRRLNKPVLQLDKNTGEVIREWQCAADAWREIGVYYGNISACCLGKQKTAGNFIWRFATGDD